MRWYASLGRSGAFARVRQRGRRAELPFLRVFALERRSGPIRIGITVPGSVGGAVLRNLIRRRVQGALDALPPSSQPIRPADVVFLARDTAGLAPYASLAEDVRAGLGRVCGP